MFTYRQVIYPFSYLPLPEIISSHIPSTQEANSHNPTPDIHPSTTRLLFVLSIPKAYCIIPSTNVGSINMKAHASIHISNVAYMSPVYSQHMPAARSIEPIMLVHLQHKIKHFPKKQGALSARSLHKGTLPTFPKNSFMNLHTSNSLPFHPYTYATQ